VISWLPERGSNVARRVAAAKGDFLRMPGQESSWEMQMRIECWKSRRGIPALALLVGLLPASFVAAEDDPIDLVLDPVAVPELQEFVNDIGGIAAVGPDVIVGDLHNVSNYGHTGGISAFAIGTYSCNVGTMRLNWYEFTNQHPVIGQSMYRLKNGRFEHIGQSWLKHGYFALSNSLCNTCNDQTDGTQLGVGCADPYGSGLNGTQSDLGPKYQVNANIGDFPYPPANPSYSGILARRLQVHDSDLDPAMDGGGLYFVEGHYVTPDDAAWGNKNNNASYRRVTVAFSAAQNRWNITLQDSTQREKPAIRAWKVNDATVTETDIQVPGEGLFILAAKATDVGGGWYEYEYALHNLNSDRSGQSFSVTLYAGTSVQNLGFHDVDYHSGEPYSGTDWTTAFNDSVVMWSTQTYAVNQNANALRWGTLYNFRFQADRAPTTGLVSLGLFKPGTPVSVSGSTVVPGGCTDNGQCDDGVFCNGAETCDGGNCRSATGPACPDDGLYCTGVESCDEVLGCQSTGDPCNFPDVCDENTDSCVPSYSCDPADVSSLGSRYFSVTASPAIPAAVALRVVGDPGNPEVACTDLYVQADGTLGANPVYQTPAAWGNLAVSSPETVPSMTYSVSVRCGDVFSAPSPLTLRRWGDLDNNDVVDVSDISASLDGFAGMFSGEVTFESVDETPCQPDGALTVDDITAVLDAFAGAPYTNSCPMPCP